MGITALIIGIVGGLCAVMGVVTAMGVDTIAGIVPLVSATYAWVFWFGLSIILLLICIAFAVNRGGVGE